MGINPKSLKSGHLPILSIAVRIGNGPKTRDNNYTWLEARRRISQIPLGGYDEAMLLYILGLGSPTHPLPMNSYTAWASTYRWENCYGYEYLYAGSLFTHQFSHVWIDFRGIQDAPCMKRALIISRSRRATYVQQQYAIDNPINLQAMAHIVGELQQATSGRKTIIVNGTKRKFFNYKARGVPFGPDDGTIAPWAVVSSLPFTPEIVLPAIDYFIISGQINRVQPVCFKSTFNQTFPLKSTNPYGWSLPGIMGLIKVRLF